MKKMPLHVGQRNLKTALAASLCALAYFFLERNPAFACIGAIFGMGADMEGSKLHGGNRLFGTILGGLLGRGAQLFGHGGKVCAGVVAQYILRHLVYIAGKGGARRAAGQRSVGRS